MGCKCAERSIQAHLDEGYVWEGDYLVKGDDRVHRDEVHKHHFRETAKRPKVAVRAARNVAKSLLERIG